MSRQIKDRDTQNQRVRDNLYRLAILARGERGALRLMASYDFIQGADQRVNIEISVYSHRSRDVVQRAIGFHAIQYPQSLLSKRKRQGLVPGDPHDPRTFSIFNGARRFGLLCETGNGGRLKHGAQREFDIKSSPDAGYDLRGEKGMAAQVEEVDVDAQLLFRPAQNLGPDIRDNLLGWSSRRDIAFRLCAVFWFWQSLAVDLAIRVQRQLG